MSVDERSRLQLAEAAKRVFGADEGITLMELLPPSAIYGAIMGAMIGALVSVTKL